MRTKVVYEYWVNKKGCSEENNLGSVNHGPSHYKIGWI